jgi:hypothetical protein
MQEQNYSLIMERSLTIKYIVQNDLIRLITSPLTNSGLTVFC